MERALVDPKQPETGSGLIPILVTAEGVFRDADPSRVRELSSQGRSFWIDLIGDDAPARSAWIAELGCDASDAAWLQRFGQAGRISLDRGRLRASTWLSEGAGKGLSEIHVLTLRTFVLTTWSGHPSALDRVRHRLAATLANPQGGALRSAAILLQLILSTLHDAVRGVDAYLANFQRQLAESPSEIDYPDMNFQSRRVQLTWFEVERYREAVKVALIGLNATSAIDPAGAEELAIYAEQVEDLESRLKVRSEWGADLMRDYATVIARLQSRQINRLTMVSMIFLPITFLTGFFGMNFPWMIRSLSGVEAFAALGLALPAVSVGLTALWLSRRITTVGRRRGRWRRLQ
jgi:Mg2+ and Co2+ transporter CorA